MGDVGVRQLKENLAEYLDRAERGEIVRVTDRGRPKALIGPVPGEGRIEQGVDEGWIAPARESGLRPITRWKSQRPVLDVLAEDRGR